MRKSIPVTDRRYRLVVYRSVFLGTDAVKFIATKLGCDTAAAIAVGNKMISAGLFHHVCNEHLLENRYLFYRFAAATPVAARMAPADVALHASASAARACDAFSRQLRDVHFAADAAADSAGEATSAATALAVEVSELRAELAALRRWAVSAVLVLVAGVVLGGGVVGAVLMAALAAGQLNGYFDLPRVAAPFLSSFLPLDPPPAPVPRPPPPPPEWPPASSTALPRAPSSWSGSVSGSASDGGDSARHSWGAETPHPPPVGVELVRGMGCPPGPPSLWPHRPLFLCASAAVPSLRAPPAPLPINSGAVDFTSALFSGRFLFWVAPPRAAGGGGGVASAPEVGTAVAEYFAGRTRTSAFVVQGRFAADTPVGSVLSGQAFASPLDAARLPAAWVVRVALGVLRTLAPGVRVSDPKGPAPSFLTLFAQAAQVLNVKPMGEHPDVAATCEFPEDCARLGGVFASATLTPQRRKRAATAQNVAGAVFRAGDVVTAAFYSAHFDPLTYTLSFGAGLGGDVAGPLGGQAMSLMAVLTSGEFLYKFDLWHERCWALAQGPGT